MKHLFIILLVSSIVFLGCSSQEKLAKYNDVEISFGNGGGFTGQEITYSLTSDGVLMMTDKLKNETTEITKLKANKTLNLFDQLTEINIAGLDFNQPGNMYYFIKETNKSGTQKVVWGDGENTPPQAVKDYYQLLNSYVN